MKEIKITENEAGQRLDRFLRKLMKEATLSEIYKGIRKGKIKVNGRKPKKIIYWLLMTLSILEI